MGFDTVPKATDAVPMAVEGVVQVAVQLQRLEGETGEGRSGSKCGRVEVNKDGDLPAE